jgi:hypothetical protein
MKQLILALVVTASFGQQTAPPPLPPAKPEPIQQMQQMEVTAAAAALNGLQRQLDGLAAPTRYKCMSAIGSASFCGCLTDNLPLAVDFLTYVRFTTSAPEEFGYAALTAENKRLVDDSITVRDKCVASVFPPKSQ